MIQLKIIVAPGSYKGTFSAEESAQTILNALPKNHNITIFPMADGGQGTKELLVNKTSGKNISVENIRNPIGKEIISSYGVLGDNKTAVIEMASASGATLLKDQEKDPRQTSTYGTGQLIKHAIDSGYTNLLLCLGGSATVDGGIGMAQALGIKFLDANKKELEICTGETLNQIKEIDDSNLNLPKNLKVTIAADGGDTLDYVKTFTPQKIGKHLHQDTKEIVDSLEQGLINFANILNKKYSSKIDSLYKTEDIGKIKGVSTAGGLGLGIIAFLSGRINQGFDVIGNILGIKEVLKGADLIITGEGRLARDSLTGKTPIGISRLAKTHNIPTILIAGEIGEDYHGDFEKGISTKLDPEIENAGIKTVLNSSHHLPKEVKTIESEDERIKALKQYSNQAITKIIQDYFQNHQINQG